jgi:dipeptidyl aminopeptidase/acylaminoacyl peptidase
MRQHIFMPVLHSARPITLTLHDYQTTRGVILKVVQARPRTPNGAALLYLRGGYGGAFTLDAATLCDKKSPFAQFVQAGYEVWSYEYSGCGGSNGTESCNDGAQVQDTLDILTMLSALKPTQLVLMGHSRGADAAMLAAQHAPAIDRVIAYAGCYDLTIIPQYRPQLAAHLAKWGVSSPDELAERSIQHKDLTRLQHTSVTLIHGTQDSRTSYPNAVIFANQLKNAGVTVTTYFYPHGSHYMDKYWPAELRELAF